MREMVVQETAAEATEVMQGAQGRLRKRQRRRR
jgi:hypothetical protein